jgi:uncharacterized protein YjbI with pentapeptide repeats
MSNSQRGDLTRADLRGSPLSGADLQGAISDGVQVDAPELKGAVVDPTQAGQVVSVSGVVVKEQEQ